MKKLEGKVAIITGGSTGIGLATAQLFASEGAYVYITARRQKELDAAVRLIEKNVTGIQGNVANLADLDRLYTTVKQQHDHIDILFANAGEGRYMPLEAITEADIDNVFDVNVKGTILAAQKALPLLQDGGSIILTASIGASKGQKGGTMNGASKAAVRSFARTWTTELSDRKIRVNVVSPGPINTPMLTSMGETEEQTRQILASIATTVPMKRLGNPDEVAKAVLFLASDDSSFVSGIELFIDGGVAQI